MAGPHSRITPGSCSWSHMHKETSMRYYVDANGVVHTSNTLAAKRLGK